MVESKSSQNLSISEYFQSENLNAVRARKIQDESYEWSNYPSLILILVP